MEPDDAKATADVVNQAFRGEDEVNDEDLDKDLRSLFYQLERENLIRVRRTEYKLDGQVRRAYFWSLGRLDQAMGEAGGQAGREEAELSRVYWQLPAELWARKPARAHT